MSALPQSSVPSPDVQRRQGYPVNAGGSGSGVARKGVDATTAGLPTIRSCVLSNQGSERLISSFVLIGSGMLEPIRTASPKVVANETPLVRGIHWCAFNYILN